MAGRGQGGSSESNELPSGSVTASAIYINLSVHVNKKRVVYCILEGHIILEYLLYFVLYP